MSASGKVGLKPPLCLSLTAGYHHNFSALNATSAPPATNRFVYQGTQQQYSSIHPSAPFASFLRCFLSFSLGFDPLSLTKMATATARFS